MFDWITFGEPLTFWQVLFRIVMAVAIGAAIGVEWEKKNRPAGMRTHVLVCIGAALVSLVEQATVAYVVELGSNEIGVSMGRLTTSIVAGVGFLGAGTIVMADRKITGLTTAASLWCTACLGLAVGMGFTTMAVVACILVMVVLQLMQKVVRVNSYKTLEVQFVHRAETMAFTREVFAQKEAVILDQDFHAEAQAGGTSLYTNVYSITVPGKTGYLEIMERLSEYPNVRAVRTRNV